MRIFIFLLAVCAVLAGPHPLYRQKDEVEAATKEQIRSAVRDILEATYQRAAHRNPDGTVSSVNLGLLHVTNENRKRVRDFGDQAVSVLREYVADREGWRQQIALELLGEFKSDDAFAAVVNFAEHSNVRNIAVSDMAAYPLARTRTVLTRFLSDPDPLVRDAAKRALADSGQK